MSFTYPSRVTFYKLSDDHVSIERVQARNLEIIIENPHYIKVLYIPKGRHRLWQDHIFEKCLVVLDGWEHPVLGHFGFSNQREAFDLLLNGYLKRNSSKLLHDFRNYNINDENSKD